MDAKRCVITLCLVSCMAGPLGAVGIQGSPHDLSAATGREACSFCHTPHMATAQTPRWSRQLSETVYKIYQSSSLEAKVGQPTGASKMCLSCHDGTVAMPYAATNKPGGAYIAPGEANLGTDLSDDHPISFVYSDSLAARDSQIRLASTLPEVLELDRASELQCTTCHNPHDNQYGEFLVMPNHRSEMCVSCHDLKGWVGSAHEMSSASVASSGNPNLRRSGYQTVADNGCFCCHRPHSAGGPQRLLHFDESEDNCFSCHDGSVHAANVKSQFSRPSRHDVTAYRRVHDVRESPFAASRHVECVDCHNPHAARSAGAITQAPLVQAALQGVSGVTASGSVTEQARYEYEVCFKCHADNPNRIESTITRGITQTNTRLEFDPTGPSYHPVISVGVNKNVPSLRPPLTVASVIYCTDCHNSSSRTGVRGPHGSDYSPILADNYETSDYTSESEFAYALCYDCHSRNSILSDESFPQHRVHLDERIPCSACHDAHGISSAQGTNTNNTHLINFDTTIVSPDPATGRLEFVDLGVFRGECYLACHNKNHSPQEY